MNKVYLYSSPAHLPFFFARHYWFVTEIDGVKTRYEVLFFADEKTGNYQHTNKFPFDVGLSMIPHQTTHCWKGVLEHTFENPDAEKLITALQISRQDYLYLKHYKITGPNSNTYVQWILDQAGMQFLLPWNALGKDFKK